jgi:hypothetical protein
MSLAIKLCGVQLRTHCDKAPPTIALGAFVCCNRLLAASRWNGEFPQRFT